MRDEYYGSGNICDKREIFAHRLILVQQYADDEEHRAAQQTAHKRNAARHFEAFAGKQVLKIFYDIRTPARQNVVYVLEDVGGDKAHHNGKNGQKRIVVVALVAHFEALAQPAEHYCAGQKADNYTNRISIDGNFAIE